VVLTKRIFTRTLTFIAAFVVAGAALAPVASAAPESAFTRCRDGLTPSATYHTSLINSDSSAAVGVPAEFWPGDVFRIRATGVMHTSLLPWDDYTPDGRAGDPAPTGDPAWPGPGLTKFSLVGAFGDMLPAYMFLGSQTWCIEVSPGSHTDLRMWINDNKVSDNSGRWDITVDHWYA
jgi:hypothetical protein